MKKSASSPRARPQRAKSEPTLTQYRLDPSRLPKLTAREAAQLDVAPIDFGDIPEATADFWARAAGNKAQITLRLDREVLDFFREHGARYQTRINAVLRAFVDAQRARQGPRR